MPEGWTISELAEEATLSGRKVTSGHIRQLCKDGEIKATKVGRDWLIADEEARRWLVDWLSEKYSSGFG